MQIIETSEWIDGDTDLVALLGLKQTQENFPNGSGYASVNGSCYDLEFKVFAGNGVYKVTFAPRRERPEVSLGVHFSTGGGAFLDGGSFTVKECHPQVWVTLYGALPWAGAHRNNRDILARRPLEDGGAIPAGWEPEIVWI